jgi:hypothetical protein
MQYVVPVEGDFEIITLEKILEYDEFRFHLINCLEERAKMFFHYSDLFTISRHVLFVYSIEITSFVLWV